MVTSKWWLALFALWVGIVVICEVTEGSANVEGTSNLSVLLNSGASIDGAKAILGIFFAAFTWPYSFFQTGIGIWMKLPLVVLSIAVAIPFLIDMARLLIPWKR